MDGRPDYTGYVAKDPEQRARVRKVLGKAYWRVKAKVVYGALSYPYGVFKHSQLLRKVDRTSTHTYTCFYRAPTQLRTLSGPVLNFLGRQERNGKRLEIVVMACSNGAEPYTIASWLTQQVPDLDFHITATDLHQSMVDKAATGEYTRDEALHSEYITPKFVAHTFDRRGTCTRSGRRCARRCPSPKPTCSTVRPFESASSLHPWSWRRTCCST